MNNNDDRSRQRPEDEPPDHVVAGPPQQSHAPTRWYNPLLARMDLLGICAIGVLIVGGMVLVRLHGNGESSAAPLPTASVAVVAYAGGASTLGQNVLSETSARTAPVIGGASPAPGASRTMSGAAAGTAGTGSSELQKSLSNAGTTLAGGPNGSGATAAPPIQFPQFTIPPMNRPVPNPLATAPPAFTVPPVGGNAPPGDMVAQADPSSIVVSGGVAPRGQTQATQPVGGAQIPGAPPGSQITTPYAGVAAQRAAFGQTNAPAGYLDSAEREPLSPFDVFAGTPLRCALDDDINTDLPGIITAHITDDIHASLKPYPIVIPKGTTIIGEYNSAVVPGDSRAQIAWDTMTMPDGRSFDLRGMAGADVSGATGLGAHVDNHTARIVTTTLITALLGAGLQLAQPVTAVGSVILPSVGQTVAGAVGNSLNQSAQQVLNQQVQRPPTLTVPRGTPFIIRLRSTISLEPYTRSPRDSGSAPQ